MIDYDINKLTDDEIGIMLNRIEQRKCKFGANVNELKKESEALINELKRRDYTIEYINVN